MAIHRESYITKSDVYDNLDTEKRRVLAVLQDKSMSAQEKYDELYDKFKDEGLTRLPLLLGIYTDENFKTKPEVEGGDEKMRMLIRSEEVQRLMRDITLKE